MKRTLSFVLCLLLAVSMLAGCGQTTATPAAASSASVEAAASDSATPEATPSPTPEAPKPVEITIGVWPEDNAEADLKTFEGYKAVMAEKYPYITVTPASYRFTPETFLPLAESGQLPTIYNTYFTEPEKIIKNNYAADITDIVRQYGYDAAINKDLLDLMTRDGKIYGLPRDAYALGLYLNMNLFKQAGLVDANGLPQYPKTFDELVSTAKTIKEKTGKAGMFIPTKDHVGGWHFNALAWCFGAQFEKEVDGKWMSNINSPEAIEAMQYVKDLKWTHNVLLENALLSWGDWIQNYGTDNVGMVFAAADVIDAPIKDYGMSKDAVSIAPIPAGPKGGRASLMGGSIYMFSPKSTPEQLDAAFKFLEVMGYTPKTTDEAMTGYEANRKTRNEEGIPVGPSSIKIWSNPERIAKETAIDQKYTNVNMDLFKPYYDSAMGVLHPEEPYFTQDLYGVLDNVLQAVISDKNADVKALMEAANTEFQTKFMDTLAK